MQRNVNNLIGNNLDAVDGEIGKVVDFYFDDYSWTVRYLVVQTGNWFSERKVLISRHALINHAWESGIFPINLTKDQVRHSPDIDAEKPVSRLHEQQLADYYAWEPYWGTAFGPGQVWGVIPPTPVINPDMIKGDSEISMTKDDSEITAPAGDTHLHTGDTHLRSCKQITGYHIQTNDGEIGHVNDFILDDQTWQISYMVVDTHNWIGGKKVLVAVRHIKELRWDDSRVVVDISIEEIKESTPIDKWDYIIPEGDKTESQQFDFLLK